jgi:dienelactone hydrolase
MRTLWQAAIVAAGILVSAPAQTDATTRPRVVLTPPGDALVGTPTAVRAEHLPPDRDVVLFSALVDRQGRLWTGAATYRSSPDGVVDPAGMAPTDAPWEGVDPRGPFWAPELRTLAEACDAPGGGHAERLSISVLVDGVPVATASALRWLRHPDVEELPVDADGVVARLYARRGADRLPAVVVLPGSEGGIPTGTAEQLASHGYVALALAYFGEPGLPEALELVPLEYVDRAIDWLAAHARVDPARIALWGGSKGGELVLLMASRRRDLRAVVAAVPSSVVFQSIGRGFRRTSSWGVGGDGLPFVPYAASARYRESRRLVDLYEDSLRDEGAVEAARIPIERATCPLLLLSGSDDRIWPSRSMCEAIERRLREAGSPHRVVHLAYDDAGHGVLAPGFRPLRWSEDRGGSRQGHAAAHADGWVRTLAFLDQRLRRD